jgi:hypothetical protein
MNDSHAPTPPLLPKFTPVPRKNTVSHGWTLDKQRGFIEALAMTGSVRMAAEAVGMSHCGVYKLRNAPGAASFVRAWDAAVSLGAARIRDVLFDHAIHVVPETVVVGKDTRIERRKFNHRTMIWALQHHMPDQYPGGPTLRRPRDPEAEGYIKMTPELVAEARETILQRIAAIKARRARIAAAGTGGVPPDDPAAGN